MANNRLPCLDLLAATPDILRSLTDGLSDEDARWKPAPDRFSVAEVLAHLSHSEGHCYRVRLDAIAYEQRPHIERDDAALHLDLYRDRDPEDELAHFEEQRKTNLEFLRELPPAVDAHTPAIHIELGEVTLGQILHEWALHDLGHIRQVTELVRARKYYPGAGPFQRYYDLKP